ncbi:MAG: DUF1028 domain-containing protein [Pseudomonadota bacterium]
MTWSILAKDSDTGFIGMAVASKFFAVGAVVPWSDGRVGGVMTQALPNPEYGPRGLEMLRQGHRAEAVRDALTAPDPNRDQRQLHLMEWSGETAAWTGENCVDWCGHVAGPGVSVAGNMLAGEQVVRETRDAWLGGGGTPIVERLIAAMKAGEAAGGDKRGRQSIGLRVQGPECYPRLDMRVDDHEDPIAELERIYAVARERYIPFSAGMPRRDRPWGVGDRDAIERVIAREAGRPFRDIDDIGG